METNKEPDLFQNISQAERIKALSEMCDNKGTEKVRRHYTADEKLQMKYFAVEEGINLMKKEAEFADIRKAFNVAIKEYKVGIFDALKNLDKGYSENEETVFMIADQETGMMNVYDQFGMFLYARKLYAEERQATILSVAN